MKILIVTDAWEPQVNGVIRTLKNTCRELIAMDHQVEMLTPLQFKTIACPTYPEIRLSLFPARGVKRRIEAVQPDAIHIATEGPLGMATRRYARKNQLPYTTAYHTRFPEYVKPRFAIPLSVTYAFLRWFHKHSQAVLVPTQVVKRDLERYGFGNVVLWSRGVDLEKFTPEPRQLSLDARPVFLYVGRVAIEKNVEAFLQLDLPGSKWVAGEGPLLETLRNKYPQVHYTGVLMQPALAEIYRNANVFAFPSKTDTFGLVLLEAIACGTPVAAYPVTGPIDVIGESDAGALNEDFQQACLDALKIPRSRARALAETFSWPAATEQFYTYLKPIDKTQDASALNRPKPA